MSHNPIFAVNDRANELRAAGIDVISLAAGESDSATSPHIVAAAKQALDDPASHHYGSAAGLPVLREAVAARLCRSLGSAWSADDVLITLGAKHALYLGLQAVLEPGDRVIVARPGWPGHEGAVAAAGGEVDYVDAPAEAGFLVTAEALDAAWLPRTKALIVASPANPTGAVYSADDWLAIAQWAHRHDVWVIADEVYEALVYDGSHTPLLSIAPSLRERCMLVNSVSKAHAMTGWRVGWLAAPPHVIDDAARTVSGTMTHVPQFTQIAALQALNGDPAILDATISSYRQRRNRLHSHLQSIAGIDCALPSGGMFAFPAVRHLLEDNNFGLQTSAELASWLLDNAHVAVVPGEAFQAPGHLRVCFAIDDDRLDEAAHRVGTALNALRTSGRVSGLSSG